MDLKDLGFDAWFDQRRKEAGATPHRVARVSAVDRDSYLVRDENGEVPAQLAGRVMFSAGSSAELPCVGDWALVQHLDRDTHAIIHGVLPRKTFLRRKAAGEKVDYQLIAANIDAAFIVQACDADFNLRRLERYLVIVKDGRVEPRLLLSKSDLVGAHDLGEMVSAVHDAGIACPVIPLSVATGSGLDAVRNSLKKGKTYCLLGSSGVGKTTLLNHLIGRDAFKTKEVREKDRKGRHATTRRQLILLESGAMVIDTPGMRELGLIGDGAGLQESFSDISGLSPRCRFGDCSHTTEPGCAILAAVAAGEVQEERYRAYIKLTRESEFHRLSYVEKRRKDRDFGRMVKSVLKHKRKR